MNKLLSIPKLIFLIGAGIFFMIPIQAQKFYPDDPLEKEPAPWPTVGPERRQLSGILETVSSIFGDPGEQHPEKGVIPAQAVNTLGEVMDGPWYVNRHFRNRMTLEELRRGPGDQFPPSQDMPWYVLTTKKYGSRSGLLIKDSKDHLYLIRFDSSGHLDMATGADMVSSRFMHALGYHVPEKYLVYFERSQLRASEAGEEITSMGEVRDLLEETIDDFLKGVARNSSKGYRAVATRIPGQWEGLLGPFQVYGTRSDDPNDIITHEHRRDLRGLYVFCAWLNHSDMSALHTQDVIVVENDIPFILHYLIAFGTTLGSGGDATKLAWEGNQLLYDRGTALKNMIGMGVYSPKWMRPRVPRYQGVGSFHYSAFDPDKWTTKTQLAPFQNRLPDDDYWAARQVMAFTDEEIRAIVETGQYSDPRAVDWLVKCLIERRNQIGQNYLTRVLPLDNFRVENDQILFEDLAVTHRIVRSRSYSLEWSEFDNETEDQTNLGQPVRNREIPSEVRNADEGKIFSAKIIADDPEMAVTTYLRKQTNGLKVIGLDRSWPGKLLAESAFDDDTFINNYSELFPRQQQIFEKYTEDYNQRTGRSLSAEEYFSRVTMSERTTFYGITHALMRSELTDEQGNSIGPAIDLVKSIERIAGQYYGRGGDQQFRLYCFLQPNTLETLEKSREFNKGHENSIYHVGYPISYRQQGNYPSIQFSVSEDGTKADIDVDYRSSKVPAALFNGHLTSANSDIRAGDNAERHSNRWTDLIEWWRNLFRDDVEEEEEEDEDELLSYVNEEVPTALPADRQERAEPADLQDAAQEFLTDWLVRHELDEAEHFFGDQMVACVDTDDDVEDEVLLSERARDALRDIMKAAEEELGDKDNLTEAIDAVETWDPSDRLINHPWEGDFTLVELAYEDSDEFLCSPLPGGTTTKQSTGQMYGTFYATLFRFKVAGENGAIFGLLWMKVNGKWRIVSFEAFEQ